MTTVDPPVRPFGDRLDVRLAVCAAGSAVLAAVAALAGRGYLMWPSLLVTLVLLASAAWVSLRVDVAPVSHEASSPAIAAGHGGASGAISPPAPPLRAISPR